MANLFEKLGALPLTSVRIQNFKSVPDSTLELKPLTILLGSNSAGKSTFLQALILAAQNFRGGTTYSFDLNNSSLTFGPLSEALFRGATSASTFGFEFIFGGEEPYVDRRYAVKVTLDASRKNLGKSSIPVKTFSISEDHEGHHSRLDIRVPHGNPSQEATMVGTFLSHGDLFYRRSRLHKLVDLRKISATFSPQQDDRYLPGFQMERVIYLNQEVRIGLLERFIIESKPRTGRFSNIDDLFREYTDRLSHALRAARKSKNNPVENPQLSDWVNSLQGESAVGQEKLKEKLRLGGQEFQRLDLFKGIKSVTEVEFAVFLWSKSRAGHKWLSQKTPQLLPISGEREREAYQNAISFFHTQISGLRSGLNYLGPLRAHLLSEQKNGVPIHSWAPIGVRGEMLAYQLAHDRNRFPKLYPVPARKRGKVVFVTESLSLLDAVNRWVAWFDLGDSLASKDEGVWGSFLELDNEKFHQKGTGISQVIPVITICLLASSESLTLIEQPELHLHPGLQQKLGTFFGEVVKTGRRLLIETHSEYIVTRVRREIATKNLENSMVSLTFVSSVKPKNKPKYSVYEQVPISATGIVARWPQAFYDFTANDKLAIYEANNDG